MKIVEGQAQSALTAADVVLVASGTATLDTLLCKRPMVVAYRLGALTAFALGHLGLMKAPFFAQPNLLAGRRVVPELAQGDVTPERLGREIERWLDAPQAVASSKHFSRPFTGNCARRERAGREAVLGLARGGPLSGRPVPAASAGGLAAGVDEAGRGPCRPGGRRGGHP